MADLIMSHLIPVKTVTSIEEFADVFPNIMFQQEAPTWMNTRELCDIND